MTVDEQALRETLDQVIDADALGNWSQEHWFVPEGATTWVGGFEDESYRWGPECGSGGCFLGHRAIMDGATHHLMQIGKAKLPDGTVLTHDAAMWSETKDRIDWTDWGQARFGIDRPTASKLFDHRNSLNDLKILVDAICAGESVADFSPEHSDD